MQTRLTNQIALKHVTFEAFETKLPSNSDIPVNQICFIVSLEIKFQKFL